MKRLSIFLALLLLVPAPELNAEGLQGGLAVAISADGKTLVAGGRNRALYELDPTTLAVKRRAHLGRQIMKMAFAPSGKVLIVESTDAVQWVDLATLQPTKTLEKASRITLAPAAGLVGINAKNRPQGVKLLDIETGAEKASVPYDPMIGLSGFALSPDGKQVALLYSRRRDDGEKKVAYKDIPKDLKNAARNEFMLRGDGYTCQFVVVDVASGKPTLEAKTWYGAPDGANIGFLSGGAWHFVGYKNQCVRFDAKGEATYFELTNSADATRSHHYARHASVDGTVLLTGSLRIGARTQMPDRKPVYFELDRLEGFPEYFKSFDLAGDGTAYAGTTAHRVIRIGADGAIQSSQPVY